MEFVFSDLVQWVVIPGIVAMVGWLYKLDNRIHLNSLSFVDADIRVADGLRREIGEMRDRVEREYVKKEQLQAVEERFAETTAAIREDLKGMRMEQRDDFRRIHERLDAIQGSRRHDDTRDS